MSHIPLTPKGMPRKAIAEQGSPQQLIKQFLRENLPDFPSMFDETQATGSFGISGFSGGGSVAANSTSFSAFSRASSEADEDTDSYQLSVDEHLPELNESSVALSLPDSFDASYFKQLDTLAAVTTNKKGHNKVSLIISVQYSSDLT